jgi:Uma2 family endonuclease
MSESARRKATLEDFWAIPEAARFHELIDGELVEKAAPTGEHGGAQAGIVPGVDLLRRRKPDQFREVDRRRSFRIDRERVAFAT